MVGWREKTHKHLIILYTVLNAITPNKEREKAAASAGHSNEVFHRKGEGLNRAFQYMIIWL